MAALIPEDAPGWAIRLEAKLDIAIAQHGQAIESLSREVADLRRERERDVERLDKADAAADARIDAHDRANYVTAKGLFAALAGTIAGLAGLAALINSAASIL